MAVLGAGAGGNAFPRVIFFGSSTTYTPAVSVTALVHVFGGGGSGGSAAATTSYKTASSGGGAGEHGGEGAGDGGAGEEAGEW